MTACHIPPLAGQILTRCQEFRRYKHTINVKPSERPTYLVTANEPRRWAYHCHLLYHMETGMFREVHIA